MKYRLRNWNISQLGGGQGCTIQDLLVTNDVTKLMHVLSVPDSCMCDVLEYLRHFSGSLTKKYCC